MKMWRRRNYPNLLVTTTACTTARCNVQDLQSGLPNYMVENQNKYHIYCLWILDMAAPGSFDYLKGRMWHDVCIVLQAGKGSLRGVGWWVEEGGILFENLKVEY